jgi:hypothetical protein
MPRPAVLINHEGKVGELLIDEGSPGYAFQLLAGLELLKHDAMHCIGEEFVNEDE